MNDSKYKEVHFYVYCKKCKYEKTEESERPCCDCLTNPVNIDSHKPTEFEEKD